MVHVSFFSSVISQNNLSSGLLLILFLTVNIPFSKSIEQTDGFELLNPRKLDHDYGVLSFSAIKSPFYPEARSMYMFIINSLT